MGRIAEELLDLMMLLPEAERRDFVRLVLSARADDRPRRESSAERVELPCFQGGRWLAKTLCRDEIYADESEHALRG
jgi:hypothetical protein